jgi:hypothetical protein
MLSSGLPLGNAFRADAPAFRLFISNGPGAMVFILCNKFGAAFFGLFAGYRGSVS